MGDFADYVAVMRPKLRRQAYLLCGDWYEADDLVQDTLAILYRRWPDLLAPARSDGYARRVLTRVFLTIRRRLRWRREVLSSELPELPWVVDDSLDLRISLLAHVRLLPPRQRAVILMRFWEDRSIEQTAAMLGVTAGTVASQTNKALTTLRVSLGGPGKKTGASRRVYGWRSSSPTKGGTL